MDPAAELNRVLDVREAALARFNNDAIPAGQDLASLRRAFVPIWLLHRYQTEASAKLLGGVYTPIALSGDGLAVTPVPSSQQEAALEALMRALSVEALTVPAHLQPALSFGPRTNYDYSTYIEVIPTAGGSVFDPMRAAEIGAFAVLGNLLAPERLNRLDIQQAGGVAGPDVDAILSRLIGHANNCADEGALGRRIATTIALSLAKTSREASLSRAIAYQIEGRIAAWARELGNSRARGAQGDWARGLGALLADRDALEEALKDGDLMPSIPPGSPIG